MIDTDSHVQSLEFSLPSGRVHAERRGPVDAPLVIGVPGITANLRSFDALAPVLARAGMQVVVVDLRGRGHSEVTAPGTYGWPAHARDIAAVADAMGVQRFDVVGHSMGGFVGMQLAADLPERVRRLVTVDALGAPEPESLPPIIAASQRLGVVFPDAASYVARVRASSAIEEWGDLWQGHYEYELQEAPAGGVIARTSREAGAEDGAYGAVAVATLPELWSRIACPVLLLRAARPIVPGAGYIVSAADRDRLGELIPGARIVEIDGNHYGIIAHADAAAATVQFLS
jgi:pimeloyl-ACP methyl ester carboxylesterase